MVVLNKIYTRTGDDGTTGLFFGGRVRKDDPRPEAYGTVDEAQAAIGVARATANQAGTDGELDDILVRRLSLSLGWTGSIISLSIPMLAWAVGLGVALRTRVHRNFAALKRLVSQLAPACPSCNRDLSAIRVGPRCPDCYARIPVIAIRG